MRQQCYGWRTYLESCLKRSVRNGKRQRFSSVANQQREYPSPKASVRLLYPRSPWTCHLFGLSHPRPTSEFLVVVSIELIVQARLVWLTRSINRFCRFLGNAIINSRSVIVISITNQVDAGVWRWKMYFLLLLESLAKIESSLHVEDFSRQGGAVEYSKNVAILHRVATCCLAWWADLNQ